MASEKESDAKRQQGSICAECIYLFGNSKFLGTAKINKLAGQIDKPEGPYMARGP